MDKAYISICKKYGPLPLFGADLVVVVAFATGHVAMAVGGIVGLLSAVIGAEGFLAAWLRSHNFRLSEGSKILRRAQFACAALGVCAGIGVESIVNLQPHHPRKAAPAASAHPHKPIPRS